MRTALFSPGSAGKPVLLLPHGISMPKRLLEKLCASRTSRNLAMIYGVILFNVGAVVLYEKVGGSGLTLDATLLWGGGCLVIGLAVFLAGCACRSRG